MQDSNTTIGELLFELTELLSIEEPAIAHSQAVIILESLLDMNRVDIFNNTNTSIDTKNQKKAFAIAQKHVDGMPLAYALGNQYFFSKEFQVSEATLIPRPDTETLIVSILEKEKEQSLTFLELGTGSGIIPEVLTLENPKWLGITVDFSVDALEMANKNCGDNVLLLASDKFSAVRAEKQFDFIVSNPPYIPTEVVHNLEDCVKEYEPLSALDGGDDGLDFYRYLATEGEMYLKENGRIYLEIGYDQGESVPELLNAAGWSDITCIKDLGGRDRVVTAVRA